PRVTSVAPSSEAAAAGLRAGDIIVAINGAETARRRVSAVSEELAAPADLPLHVRVERASEPMLLDLTFAPGEGVALETSQPRLTISTPLLGTPAHRAGVRPNDVIVAVDGQSAVDWSLDEAVRHITGPEGS